MEIIRYRLSGLRDVLPIYGASWNKGSSPTLTRIYDATGMTAAAGVGAGVVTNDFDDAPLFRDIKPAYDSLGNVFIRIPKLYIRKTDGTNYKTWEVSQYQYPGFYLPWCFWDFTNSVELPYVDIGKYKATSDGGGTPKLESKPDLYPLSNQNIVTFRTYAEANNTGGLLGYQQLDIHAIDVLQTLMTIEFATLNLQSVMYGFGTGRYGIETELATADTVADNYIVVSNATRTNYRVGQTISVGTARYGTQVFYGRTITAIDADTPGAGSTTITFDGDPVSISTGAFLQNTGWKNGFSANIAAASGSLVSNSDGKYPCVYRGIESPYGDLFQWVDGLNIDGGATWVTATPYTAGQIVIGTTTTETYRCTANHTSDADNKPSTGADWADYWELYAHRQAWVCADADDYTSNVFAAPYEQLSYINHGVNNYIQSMGWDSDNPYAMLPTAVQASGSQYYCDYYTQATGPRVALFGGYWFGGATVGPWYWSLRNSSASAGADIGGRLMRKAV